MSTDDTFTDVSDSHIPDMQISSDGDYDVSTMMDITHRNQEAEGESDDGTSSSDDEGEVFGDDTSSDVSDDDGFEDSDESSDLEGDDSEEEDDGSEDGGESGGTDEEHGKDDITFKVGDKEVKVSKDAEVELKIDGQVEKMSLREALNEASGKIHVRRELKRISDRDSKFQQDLDNFRTETQKVNENAEALLSIKDPYELCEYICDLKGGDPDQLLNDMVKSTLEHLEKYKSMSDRELQLERENRKYKREQRQREAQEKVAQRNQQKTQKEESLKSSLGEEGFTMEDFISTIDFLQEKSRNGEEFGFDLDTIENPTEDDIIEYMVVKDLHDRVTNGIEKLNAKLLDDDTFVGKAKQAILRTESLSGKMSQAEVDVFLKQALKLDNKALGKTLSKSVKKTNSKKATLQGQEEFDDEGPGSLEELNSSIRNLTF